MIRLQNINLTSTEAIQRLANNHAIAVNLRDAFPYPYTIEDAITVCYIKNYFMLAFIFIVCLYGIQLVYK